MRKSDKLKNFKKVNLLVEQRYLESKGIVTESVIDMWVNLKPTESLYNALISNPNERWMLTNLIIGDNGLSIQVNGKPVQFLRKDTHMNQSNGKGQSDKDSFFYSIRLTKINGGKLRWELFAETDNEQLNERPLVSDNWDSEDVGSLDDRKFFEILKIN